MHGIDSAQRSGAPSIDSAQRSGAPSIDSAQRSGAPFIDSAQRSGAPFIDSAQRSGAPFIDELSQAITPRLVSEQRFVLDVPDGWQQGRGAFGGLVLGALTRAILDCEPADPRGPRRLRSLAGELAGPVMPGPASIEVTPLRRGTGVSTVSAMLSQDGVPLARASAVLGRTRITDREIAPAPPHWTGEAPWDAPPLRSNIDSAQRSEAPSIEGAGSPTGEARFARHFEYRLLPPWPFSGAGEAVAEGWVRPRRAPAALGEPELVALADAWWPAVLALEKTPRPASTVAFTAQLFPATQPLDPSLPLYHRARVLAAHDGYVVEQRELWSATGALLVLNQQTFVIIK